MKEELKEKHIIKEGSRRHVITYSTQGMYCSEPNCEVNHDRNTRIKEEKDG
jgi:hypothetical protein